MHYNGDLLIYIYVPCAKKQQFAGKPPTILLHSHEKVFLVLEKLLTK